MNDYANNAPKTYRLARDGAFQIVPFGPLMTLAQAESYQVDMTLAGFPCLVVNVNAMQSTEERNKL